MPARSPEASFGSAGLTPGRGQVILGSGGAAPEAAAPEQMAGIYRLGDPALSELALEPLLDELPRARGGDPACRHRRDHAVRRGHR
jgi:hypothetical protein